MGRKVRIFDNNGATIDRYTVVISDSEADQDEIYTMSENPDNFNQFSHVGLLNSTEPFITETELATCPECILKAIHQRLDIGDN